MSRVAVVGAGAWGTVLADLLARKGAAVSLWAYEPDVVESINRAHENSRYLPGASLAPNVRAVADVAEAVRDAEIVVSAAPSHVVTQLLARAVPALERGALVVSASKGLEPERLTTLTCALRDVLPTGTPVAALSGPSFAREVYERAPTALVAAAREPGVAERVQQAFATKHLRVYTETDVLGVELGGALKNVIALAAGMLEGLGLGYNTRAALLTRGLAEITRLGVALGAEAETFAGLTGMGDLLLTATAPLSRNHTLGIELGHGISLEGALGGRQTVAEGVTTARAAVTLGARHGVELPIAEQVCAVLFQGKHPRDAVAALMERTPKAERVR
ncbi:MAG TPA: NAD(P)H-dependent glycerol-3-phosphate dehydrogenase [Gemmatimonadales bacterium]|nr:NAD(P)H-dependent glycerol-3-phosphate dehydrogenase [Gemmatimonadales bacterium]